MITKLQSLPTALKVLYGTGAAIIAGVLLYLVGSFGWKGVVAIDHWQRAKEPLICVKSHTVDHSHYGYGYIGGKYQYGWIFDVYDVCDKTAPNPYYHGKK